MTGSQRKQLSGGVGNHCDYNYWLKDLAEGIGDIGDGAFY
jgi:hypothetical protein